VPTKNTLHRKLAARRIRLHRQLERAMRTWCTVMRRWSSGDWHVSPKPWEAFSEIQRICADLGAPLPTSFGRPER
jgi:hypothetical protein